MDAIFLFTAFYLFYWWWYVFTLTSDHHHLTCIACWKYRYQLGSHFHCHIAQFPIVQYWHTYCNLYSKHFSTTNNTPKKQLLQQRFYPYCVVDSFFTKQMLFVFVRSLSLWPPKKQITRHSLLRNCQKMMILKVSVALIQPSASNLACPCKDWRGKKKTGKHVVKRHMGEPIFFPPAS